MLKYMHRDVPFGNLKALTYFGTIIGHLFEAAHQNQTDRLKDLIALAAVFVDETATEGGSHYVLPWLLTGLDEPPWNDIVARGSGKKSLGAHSKLADSKWVAINQAYLADIEKMTERVDRMNKGVKPKKEDE